jgi:RNA polymerase sigma-70 factor (ECF subfamily)
MYRDDSFADLLARLRGGDPDAASAIFRRFAQRLIGLARLHLDARLRRKVDPEDVVQSALKSFFVRHAGGEYDLHSWDSLWSLLTVITLRKCGHKLEYFQAACRDVRREAVPDTDGDASAPWEALAREPRPEEALELAETVAELFRGFDPEHRQILELILQGRSIVEISDQLGSSERTVYRRLERIKLQLQRLRGGLEAS